MRRGKRLIATLSCMALCLGGMTGCSKKKETITSGSEVNEVNVAKEESAEKAEAEAGNLGCYVDEQINEPEYQEGEYCTSFFMDQKGNLKIITTQYKYDSTDVMQPEDAGISPAQSVYCIYTWTEGTWVKEELCGLDSLDSNQYVTDFLEYYEGRYYVVCNQYSLEGEDEEQQVSKAEYMLYDYDSTTHELKDVSPEQWIDESALDEEENQWWGPENLTVGSEGEVLYLTYATNEIHIYNPETKENNTIDCQEGVNRFVVSDRKIYYKTWDKILIYNLDTQEEESIAISMGGNESLTVTKDGDLYMVGESGIQYWNQETSSWDTIMKGKDSLLGIGQNYLDYVAAVDGDHDEFFIRTQSQESKIIHTYYDTSVSNVKEHSLTIYSLVENECIQNAVAKYQQTHKDTDVDYIVGLEQDEQGLVGDELKRINSELLAGNGADIYVLNGLPTDEFVEKGVLSDLSYLLKPIADQGEFLEHMMEHYTQESGEIYQYPVRMTVPFSIYNSLVTKSDPTLEDLIQLTQNNEKVKYAIGNTAGTFMVSSLLEYGQEWITKEKTIDIEQWKTFVNDMLRAKDYCYAYQDYTESFVGENYEYLYTYPYDRIYSDISGIITGACLRNDESESNMSDFIRLQAIVDQYDCHYSLINHSFTPLARIGMNQNGKNKEQAESFIQCIFSEEYQYDKAAYSLPVTKTALKKSIIPDPEQMENSSYGFGFENININIDGKDIRQDFMEDIYELICTVEHPFMEDTKLLILMANQTAKVLSGEVTLEDASNELVNTLELYLSE